MSRKEPFVWLAVFAAVCVALTVAFFAGCFRPTPSPTTPPGTAELVAETPSGVRVWKVTGPGLVVPYVFAESRSGSLSSR